MREHSWLAWFFKGLIFLSFLILLARVIELQVIKGDYFRVLANDNRIRKVAIKAPRGLVKSADNETLAQNHAIKKRIIFDPNEGYKKIDEVEGAPGEEIITEYTRYYSYGADAGHLTGYVGEVSEEEVGKVNPDCPEKGAYKMDDVVGKSGIEYQYECKLRGIDGEELIEVNSTGKKIRVLGTKPATPGEDISLTIDAGLQRKTALSMNGKKGGVIATSADGAILAFYSSPSYDPNAFIGTDTVSLNKRHKFLTDGNLPLFNRVISGGYHPGSIFKIVTSIGALEEDKIDENYQYRDEGVIKIGDFSYSNWYFTQYGGIEGLIDLTRAVARSTDTFFYKVGEILGVEDLAHWSRKFGLGSKTGIDLPGEIEGLVPDPAWKRKAKGELWFLGNTYHMAIGQGDLVTSVLQGNLIASVVANDGKLCRPFLNESSTQVCKDLGIKKSNIDLVWKGMIDACRSGGTGVPFFDWEGNPVACKTGTAETGEKDVTHAWFNVIAQKGDEKSVLTVLIEKGGEGSKVAAPIAREILDYWIARD